MSLKPAFFAALACAAISSCAYGPLEPNVPPPAEWGPSDPRPIPGAASGQNPEKPKHRSDEQIRENLFLSLAADPGIDPFDYRFKIQNGNVEARNQFPSEDSGQERLAKIARKTPGVQSFAIVNEPSETPEAAAPNLPPNEALRRTVIDRILGDPRTEVARIGVSAQNGDITLSGSVARLETKRLAEEDARSVNGVRAVTNHLIVKLPSRRPGDAALQREILTALEMDPYFNPDEVHISVRDGVVDLVGSVPTQDEKNAVAEKVAQIRGVTAIRNHLGTNIAG